MSVRTRFAPSPTGRLHLGNVRTAIFNWLFARHHDGAFVLRIEDTDLERNVEGAEEGLLEDLRWLGLDWDEGPDIGGPHGPYRQSERGELHRAHARQLWISGRAYPCFCSEEEATGEDRRYPGTCRAIDPGEAQRRVDADEAHVLRLRTPDAGEVEVLDQVRGPITFPASDIDDFVIIRSDGRTTYNFGVVVDDLLMRISHVIRGAGHLSNTPKQQLIWEALDAAPPAFAHLPDVLSPDGGKLSKRSGAAAVADLRAEGALPEAVVNYLSLLGWSHPEEREVLTVDELVAAVDLDRVGASDTAFDPEKMRWVGQQHMSALDDGAYLASALPVLSEAGLEVDRARWVAETLRNRLATFGEIRPQLTYLTISDDARRAAFRAGIVEEGLAVNAETILLEAHRRVEGVDPWQPSAVKDMLRETGQSAEVRGRELYVPLRLAWTGEAHGPDLATLVASLGRAEAARRLRDTLNY
ncbi:MAG TPA: glutamate--tRNA ligase [Longimicrobiales bacterium]|nr:glutamate--tRNA ligase [Longimicrobiales bacterium]